MTDEKKNGSLLCETKRQRGWGISIEEDERDYGYNIATWM